MAIAAGSRFGPYELIALVGSGGMGEVYRAFDPRLRRHVAVKVLPASPATDADRLRRFQQEAQAASQLNHPNVLTVFDVGQQDGIPFIVAELLEGETLRQRLSRDRLPLRRALEVGIEVARGLAAAHERGIMHRDLKPENIFLTREGQAKILDFGLAKLIRSTDNLAEDATLTLSTEAGILLGTVGYLSPEQARGLPIDQRTDIFSLGVILYEMVSGHRAFQALTAADTIAKVLTEDPPPPSQHDPRIPPALDRTILHALEKEPHQRFQSVRDVMFVLEGMSNAPSGATAVLPAAPKGRRQTAAIALAGAAALLLGYWWLRPHTAPFPKAAAPVLLQRLTDFVGIEQSPAVSPDNKAVAFSGGAGTPQIWVRLLAGGAPLKITRGTVPHLYPRWSPDSASLIYYSPDVGLEAQGGALYDIPALGGSPRRLANSFTGGDISHDGKRITYFRWESDQLELVIAERDGGNPRVLAALAKGYDYSLPRWSPDDRQIAYQRGRVFGYDIFSVPVTGGEPRPITQGDLKLVRGYSWLPDGSGVVCSSSRNSTALYLPNMDLFVARLDGSPVRQLTYGDTSYVEPDVGSDGRIFATQLGRDFDIWEFPIAGSAADNVRRALRVTQQTGHVQTPSLDPTGQEMVYLSELGGHSNLWVMKLDGSGELRQITFEQDPDVAIGLPVWSPDGRHITFFTRRPGTAIGDQWVVHPDGSGPRRLVPEGGWAAWSQDGKWLYVSPQGREGEPYKIVKVPVAGGDAVLVRTDSSFVGSAPGPDPNALYFLRMNSRAGAIGQDVEIHVAKPEGAPSQLLARIPARRLSLPPLMQPVVSPDGKWLALMLKDGETTNLYLLPTSGGPLRPVTDFGMAATEIARRVSWSPDSNNIYAAVTHADADVVVFMSLLQR